MPGAHVLSAWPLCPLQPVGFCPEAVIPYDQRLLLAVLVAISQNNI